MKATLRQYISITLCLGFPIYKNYHDKNFQKEKYCNIKAIYIDEVKD